MDTPKKKKKRLTPKNLYIIAALVSVLIFVLYLLLRDTSSSMKVDKETISIARVEQGEFRDYVRVIGKVIPSQIIYLSVIEGGRVEERVVEEGAIVKKGNIIIRLSNPELNISILKSEADMAYQENELRNTRINMEQERLRLQQERIGLNKEHIARKRKFEQYERLVKEKLVALEDFRLAKEEYEAVREQLEVVDKRIKQEDIFRDSQIKSLDENIHNMKRSLILVRERLESLNVKAPIDGQVGNLDAQIGQTISSGERIGQLITPDLKIQASVDEHYVERVAPGLSASFDRDNKSYTLQVSKVYPEVKDGQFLTDFIFIGDRPENIRAGQTYHTNLELGDATQSTIIPKGSFYQTTAGQWIYVVSKDGVSAVKRQIKISRQNPVHYEVVEGLKAGEEVMISDYQNFGNNDRLILE